MDTQDFQREFREKLKQDIKQDIRENIKRPKVMLMGDHRWGLLWGGIIALIGVALLLDRMGISPFDRVYQFWPLLLVLFGLMNIFSQSGRFFGILLILAGGVLQLNKFGVLHLTFADLWPLALIAVGLLIIWGSLETRGVLRSKTLENFRKQVSDLGTNPHGGFNAVAVFGGCERRVSGQGFLGGKATAVFGGIELDFRDADIDGTEALLEVNCIFGGVEIRVPDAWYVHSRSLPVFGGYEDRTRQSKIDDPTGAKRKTLIITGMVVFGGVEISN
jgi:hypothetical protein